MVEEHKAEDEEAEHHGEGTGIVGIGRGDETLKLGVLPGTNRYLCSTVQVDVTSTPVVHLELKYTIDVRELELG